MRLDGVVCLAAYGDCGPGYNGTQVAYDEGGYETQPSLTMVATGSGSPAAGPSPPVGA